MLLISYFMNVADYFFTTCWVRLYGIEAEGNPCGRWMLQNGTGAFIKIVVMAGLFFLLSLLIKRCPRARVARYVIFGTYCLVTICHITLAVLLL